MKAIIEIPDRMIDVVHKLMTMEMDDEECIQELNVAVNRLKEMQEPIEVGMAEDNIVLGQDLTQEKKITWATIATFALFYELMKKVGN